MAPQLCCRAQYNPDTGLGFLNRRNRKRLPSRLINSRVNAHNVTLWPLATSQTQAPNCRSWGQQQTKVRRVVECLGCGVRTATRSKPAAKSTIGENGPWVRAEVPGASGSAVPARNAVPAATIDQCMAAWSFTPTCRIARKITSLADAGVRALLRNRAVSRIRNNAERSAKRHGQALASQTFPTADQRSSRSHHPLPIPLRPR